MNLNHLQYFLEVCKSGSIAKASLNCHVSQPSITAAVSNIERNVGYKLFDRVNNRLYLTEAGSRFRDITEEFLRQYDDYYKSAREIGGDVESKVRIAVPAVLGAILLEKLLPDLKLHHPTIQLEIFEGGTFDGIAMLQEAKIDCAIGVCDSPDKFECNSSFISYLDVQCAMSRRNPLAGNPAITMDMLSNIPLISFPVGSYLQQVLSQMLLNRQGHIVMHSNQLSTIKSALLTTGAAAIIYKDVFAPDPDIVFLPLDPRVSVSVFAFWQKGRYISPSLKKFVSYLTKRGEHLISLHE